MNILFLDQYSQLGGGQRVLLSLVAHFKAKHACTVVVPQTGPLTIELARIGVPYEIIPMGYYSLGTKTLWDTLAYAARLPFLARRLQRLIREKNIRIVYANGARTFTWGAIACARTSTPMVWHVHSIFGHGGTRAACIKYGSKPGVKRIIAVSHAAARPLSALKPKMSVLHNAVDTSIFYPGPSKDTQTRHALAGERRHLITMVGLLMPWKGMDDFIRAAAIVRCGYPHAVFAVVGDVLHNRSGDAYRRHLLKLVDKFGLEDTVVFTGFRQDVADILRASDIYVLASRQPDPCPTALLQAMACGTAAIATDSGGPKEIIENGKTGLLYPARNTEKLAAAITRLLDDERLRARIAAAGAEKIRRDHNEKSYLETVSGIIEQASGTATD